MNFLSTAIAAVSTSAILSGTAHAQSSPIEDMIATLRLPVGTTTQYYNAATQVAMSETCNIVDNSNVACDLRVIGIASAVDFTQRGMLYTVNASGNIAIDAGEFDQKDWDTDVNGGLYREWVRQGTQGSWAASSPLAMTASDGTVIQNDVRKTELRGDRAYGWSTVPISGSRGLILTQSFEDKSPARLGVQLGIVQNGAVISVPGGTASRPFLESDYNDFVVKYYTESQSPYVRAAP